MNLIPLQIEISCDQGMDRGKPYQVKECTCRQIDKAVLCADEILFLVFNLSDAPHKILAGVFTMTSSPTSFFNSACAIGESMEI